MKIFYIGRFPSPYGGVTIKNRMTFECLSNKVAIQKIDLTKVKRLNAVEFIRLLMALLSRKNTLIIGVAGKSRKYITELLFFVNRKTLMRSLLIVMGGNAHQAFLENASYFNKVNKYKRVYVETQGMKKPLEIAGMNNIDIYPNCRQKVEIIPKMFEKDSQLKCVFFSKVCEEKGIDIVIELAKLSTDINISYTIYGETNENTINILETEECKCGNFLYRGIFKGNNSEIVQELLKYDILLFPSRWKAEGVPGILVEAKMAGLLIIASDINFNSEIVKDGFDGYIVSENCCKEYLEILVYLLENPDKLNEIKIQSFKSAEKYQIDKYIDEIINVIL